MQKQCKNQQTEENNAPAKNAAPVAWVWKKHPLGALGGSLQGARAPPRAPQGPFHDILKTKTKIENSGRPAGPPQGSPGIPRGPGESPGNPRGAQVYPPITGPAIRSQVKQNIWP